MDVNFWNTRYKESKYAIICIFGHFPSDLIKTVFNQVYSGLNNDGFF
jgi:hypothetical protein